MKRPYVMRLVLLQKTVHSVCSGFSSDWVGRYPSQESSPSNAPPNPVGVVATVSILVWKSMEMDPEKGLDANEFLPQVHWQEL
jgi:hypothetical protein